MKRVRDLATLLYFLGRLSAILFAFTGIYILAVIFLNYTGVQGMPLDVAGDHFVIFLPFSKVPFVLGDYNKAYLSISISGILLYAIFLWLLSNVFLTFRQKKIFIPQNMKRLKNFYLFNFYVPILYVLLLIVFKQEFRDAIIIGFLHLMISVFIFFMATIFKQGLVLQEEQDLTF